MSVFYNLILFIRSHFIIKENDVWVFGALQGEKYSDNAKYLFEHVLDKENITAVWLTRNKALLETLQSKKIPAYHMYSKQGISYAQRAKVAIVTHRGNNHFSDLPFHAFTEKTKVVQLWHGLPLKKIAYDDKLFSFRFNEKSIFFKLKELIKRLLFPYNRYLHHPDLIVSLSPETKKIFSRAFRVSEEKVLVTGYPRNDALLEAKEKSHDVSNDCLKKVIYMPTFRGRVNSRFDVLFEQRGFDVGGLNTFLVKEGMHLDIKLHPFNSPSKELLVTLKKSSNITLIDIDDIYTVLSDYAMMITDYSSIYFDFLLLNRPIVFAPFDIDSYCKNDREFYFDYETVTPGPKAMDWAEVMSALKDFNCDSELYSEQRVKIRDRFHTYQDGRSSERVCQSIKSLVNE